MPAKELIAQISLPEQSLKKLNFCDSYKAQRVSDWAHLLRPTQVEKTSAMLYAALPEINALRCTAAVRFEMLEALRPYVQSTIIGLSKSFLQQPIPLTEAAHKSAVVAQALQKHMAEGYSLVSRELILSRKLNTKSQQLLATALHRAITGLSFILVRGLQIYTTAPPNLWRNMHILFRCADHYSLLDERIHDEVQRRGKLSSIQNCYFRSVLLVSAHPEQLSQNDIAALYDNFGEWANLLRFKLDLSTDTDCFLYLNLDADRGPQYKNRATEDEKQQLLIELDLRLLAAQFAKQSREDETETNNSAAGLTVHKDVSTALQQHLLDSWGSVAQRRYDRRNIQITTDTCIGLRDCHYFASGNQEFEQLVNNNSSTSTFDSPRVGFTPRDSFKPSNNSNDELHPIHRLEINNISQGGYCLVWTGSSPLKIQSGEIIGLREFGKRSWQIGVVRWIRQRRSSTQLGVQILSDNASGCGLAQTYDMGGYSDYMRALLLPENPATASPATLITPTAPFQEGDRVKMLDNQMTSLTKLNERLFSTGSIQQFSFQITEQKRNNHEPNEATNNGGSQW